MHREHWVSLQDDRETLVYLSVEIYGQHHNTRELRWTPTIAYLYIYIYRKTYSYTSYMFNIKSSRFTINISDRRPAVSRLICVHSDAIAEQGEW